MKKSIIILLISILYLTSCQKSDVQVLSEEMSSFVSQQTVSKTKAIWLKGIEDQKSVGCNTASPIVTFSQYSFPIIMTNSQSIAGAASFFGNGRIAVFGQNCYITQNKIFKQNVRNWLAQGEVSESQIFTINGNRNIEDAFLLADLNKFKIVYWQNSWNINNPKVMKKIEDFVYNGGGFLTGYPGWVFTAYKGFANAQEVPVNQLLIKFGLFITTNYLSGSMQTVSQVPELENSNAYFAIKAGLQTSQQQSVLLSTLLEIKIEDLKRSELINQELNKYENYQFKFPVKSSLDKLKITYLARAYDDINNPRALPNIDVFPGLVSKEAERQDVKLSLKRESKGSWLSTGFYLAAGEILTLLISENTSLKGLSVRIGCHKDSISHKDTWDRYPSITKSQKVTSRTTKIHSPFGGLVYIISSNDSDEKINVELKNVVEAPFFDLTSENPKWNLKAAAPIAEIQGHYLTMSILTKEIQALTDPREVALYWDKIVQQDHLLRGSQFERRERFVGDKQISAGYMHSGYPIMTYLDVLTIKRGKTLPQQVDVENLSKGGSWGHFHEVGHNMQRGWWTFSGTGEVTNNVFSLWGGYQCCNLTVFENGWIKNKYVPTAQKLSRSIKLDKNSVYKSWGAGEFLVQYALLQHYFGWDAYKRVFSSYEQNNKIRPSANQDKIDVWIRQMSIACQKNLVAYYDFWRMPLSQSMEKEINALNLPLWLPPSDDVVMKNVDEQYVYELRKKYNLEEI